MICCLTEELDALRFICKSLLSLALLFNSYAI
jgi:hypothetical protein